MSTYIGKVSKVRALIMSAMLLVSLIAQAQYQCNLNPDSLYHDSHTSWWTANETLLYGYQGEIYLITMLNLYTGKVPYVYKISHGGVLSEFKMLPDNKNYFLFGYEDETDYYSGTQGNFIAFTFNGDLWFFQNYKDWITTFHHPDDSYDCFARFPQDANLPYHSYYDHIPDKLAVIKRGAFQHDSTLFFLGTYALTTDPNYGKWCVQKYNYDKANDKFVFEKNMLISHLPGNRLGGMVLHMDSTGTVKMVVSTYDSYTMGVWMGWLVPETPTGGETTFTFESQNPGITTLINSKASCLLGGTVKGGRTINNVELPASSDRIVLFGYGNSNTSVINYREYAIENDVIRDVGMGSLVLPSSVTPAKWDSYNLLGATELIPAKFNNVVGNQPNGYIQQNWIYYPDGNGRICGLRFASDYWKPIPDSTVISDDLSLDAVSDSTYGPVVRSLWSLVGITDGGPPSSVDWEIWDHNHTSTTKPTELILEIEGEYSSSITTTTEDQYTEGASLNVDKKRLTFDVGMDFGQSFKNKVSSGQTWTNSLSIPFELNEESQELGFYIYVIPTITRDTYKKYPWWDQGFNYPVSQSTQYRFKTTSTAVIYRAREISQFPFLIHEPNESNLYNWKLANRTAMNTDITHSGLKPICTPSWSSPQPGLTGTFKTAVDTTSEFASKKSYKVDASVSYKKPDVFQIKGSIGHEVSYETSTENEWKLSKKVEVTLKNMTEKSLGINFSQYVVQAYWFRAEDYDWWFYDSTGTDKPWYIAYTVSNLIASVNLIFPLAGNLSDSKGVFFSWDAANIEPSDFTLFISETGHIQPSRTVYRASTGKNKNHYLSDLSFCELGKTYYWAIRAIDQNGDITWSESRSFVLGADQGQDNREGLLRIVPYPNPGSGDILNILVDTRETGTLQVKIMGLDGRVLYLASFDHTDPGTQTLLLPGLSLKPGIYLLESIINQEKVIKKLVIG